MEFYAYYYPGFFSDSYRFSGSEWKIVQEAKPRSKGHYQPRIPEMGYYSQIDTNVCKLQIDLAQSYGIRGFMICYYWDFGASKPVMAEVLQNLITALEGTTFEFNIMWVLRLPHRILPIQQGSYGKYHNHPWFKNRIQIYKEDQRFLDELARISSHPNYRKGPEGKPFLQVYSVSELIQFHGRKTKEIFSGLSAYHLQGICGRDDDWLQDAADLGIQSLSTYVTLVDFNSGKVKLSHADCISEQPHIWQGIRHRTSLPLYPSVATGWDASPRGTHQPGFRIKKFPWAPVVIDANPDDFEKNLTMAKDWCSETKTDLHIASWNEWSEGHYLEPDMRFGLEYLKRLRKIKSA